MPEIELICADSQEYLETLETESIDAIVTDPPYGLSNTSIGKKIKNAFRRCFNIMFPNFNEHNSQLFKYFDFVAKLLEGSDLSRFEILPIIEPFVGMPECSINLNSNCEIREKEVNRSTISSSVGIPNKVLVNKLDASGSKFIGNYILDLGDSIDFPIGDIGCGNFGEFFSGCFSMSISSILSPLFPNLEGDFPFPIVRNGINDIIWCSDNSGCDSFGSGFILASGTAENELMLIFDLTGRSSEFNATITTGAPNSSSELVSPKLVRTYTATSSLSAKFNPCRVSFVVHAANGAFSRYHLHLYLPKKFLPIIQDIEKKSSGFMGQQWDSYVPSVSFWRECLRVLKPGGHMLAFGGTRTIHRLVTNLEAAGFEPRDLLAWVFGEGFPKSHDISKAIDREQGLIRDKVERTRVDGKATGQTHSGFTNGMESPTLERSRVALSAEAQNYEGWGSGIKPAMELISLARKPLQGTLAQNVLKHSTGGLNIDACRIDFQNQNDIESAKTGFTGSVYGEYMKGQGRTLSNENPTQQENEPNKKGRFPSNFLHDGSNEVLELFPYSDSKCGGGPAKKPSEFLNKAGIESGFRRTDQGSAARFFYCAKASQKERGNKPEYDMPLFGITLPEERISHPTIKPIELMRYLCRLITPKNGTVLDPFMGSGSTAIAANREGFNFIGVEINKDYFELAQRRIKECGLVLTSENQKKTGNTLLE